jgi:hypothetical protein
VIGLPGNVRVYLACGVTDLRRGFDSLGVDDGVWDHSTFSKNRDWLPDGEIGAKFLAAVLAQPKVNRLLSSEHFSVDGTLIEAWASMEAKLCFIGHGLMENRSDLIVDARLTRVSGRSTGRQRVRSRYRGRGTEAQAPRTIHTQVPDALRVGRRGIANDLLKHRSDAARTCRRPPRPGHSRC